MKVCGKKDIHVPGCSDCEELEERVEAVEECCEDAQTKIEDKADTTYVDENVGTIEGQITEVSDALNERIDNIITASDPSITTLWKGDLALKGDSAHLSDDVDNYDFLDVYYKTSYYSDRGYYGYIRVPADEYENYTTTIGGIDRPSTGTGMRQYLTMLSFVDDTATIQDIRRWYWDGNAASNAEDSSYLTGIGIYRIDGVKISGGDAEIADARVGVDGTVYPSLGDAIRGQIQDTRDMIPQLVKTVQGNPIVLDDAFGEVKNLTVELLPTQEGSGTPSPQNVRPITGHDSVTVTDTGKNLFDKSVLTESASWVILPVTLPNGTYTMSTTKGTQTATGLALYFRLKGDTTLGSSTAVSNEHSVTRTGAEFEVVFRRASGTDVFANYDYQIEVGSTATSIAPYHGQSKTVTLPHTVYGAGVGVTSGTGKEKYGFKRIEDLTVKLFDSLFYVTIDGYQRNDKLKCSLFATTGKSSSQLLDGELTYNAGGAGTVWFKDSSCATPTDFTTKYAGMEICYELIDYTDLSTTPTDITLFSGDNVISSDGDMELTYVQDMATVIRKIENQL